MAPISQMEKVGPQGEIWPRTTWRGGRGAGTWCGLTQRPMFLPGSLSKASAPLGCLSCAGPEQDSAGLPRQPLPALLGLVSQG